MKKTTVLAYSDIAFIKYWGKKDEILRLPANGSLSMTLDALRTTTTVEFDASLEKDEVIIGGEKQKKEAARVIKQLNRIRTLAKNKGIIDQDIFAKVVSENSFPKGTGLSSSGSGFAALTLAATKAIGLDLSERELSILARQGSGSACRSVCAGFVEWQDADTSEESYSKTVFPADYLAIRDLVVIVSDEKKHVSSTSGHQLAETSPFFKLRLEKIAAKLEKAKDLLAEKEFMNLGELIEAEALEFHSILLTSNPPLLLWQPGTLAVMKAVQALRSTGIPVYFSINTGFNVHVLTLPDYEEIVTKKMKELSVVKEIISSGVAKGPLFLEKHLF